MLMELVRTNLGSCEYKGIVYTVLFVPCVYQVIVCKLDQQYVHTYTVTPYSDIFRWRQPSSSGKTTSQTKNTAIRLCPSCQAYIAVFRFPLQHRAVYVIRVLLHV